MRKTHAWLADGREIIYFDESDRTPLSLVDRRQLPQRADAPWLRFDALVEEWVSVAVRRQDRTYLPPDDECPLCPSVGGRISEIPAEEYDVVVFENRFPAFGGGAGGAGRAGEEPPAWFIPEPAGGRCEVVCFTSSHDSSFSDLSPQRVGTVIEAWVDRTRALSELPAVAQVFCFENRGREIGVTLSHPHGQIYGYPFVTPRTRRMLDAARRHRLHTGRNLSADILAAEVAAEERIVAHSEHWTAFVPFAARWPVEVHLYPNRWVASLPDLSEGARRDLATTYLDVLRRLEAVHGADLPYVSAWHQAPVRGDRDLAYLHLEVTSPRRAPSKLKYLAGSESAMGAFINDVAPEPAARALREVVPRS